VLISAKRCEFSGGISLSIKRVPVSLLAEYSANKSDQNHKVDFLILWRKIPSGTNLKESNTLWWNILPVSCLHNIILILKRIVLKYIN
jgi:hypothetical protein